MTYGALLPDVNELWAAARLEENGALSLRSADDRAEEAYWRHVISGFSRHAPDRYSREILDAALAVMRPYAPRTLLEIGPGWGNYTLDFAERMDKVTCVDISGDVLDFIQDAGRRAGLENIRTVHEKWEAFQPEEKADVVFGFNCFYRMPDLKEALRKVNDAAKTLCVVGMTSGPEQPYYRDFAQEMGLNVRFDRQDYIHLQLALYQLGIDPNVRTVPLVMPYRFDTEAQLLEHAKERIRDKTIDEGRVLAVMHRYFRKTGNGYGYLHPFRAALLYWASMFTV